VTFKQKSESFRKICDLFKLFPELSTEDSREEEMKEEEKMETNFSKSVFLPTEVMTPSVFVIIIAC